ncbi:MAG: sulfatase, partial [Bacteroidota bacterium]
FTTISFCQRPNIIYIMTDDLAENAISAYSEKLIATPNIDRLAKEGLRFTNYFVGNSICGPVRATVLTGQHSHKNGVKDNSTRFDSSLITVPKLMQQENYTTAHIGKWHLHSYPTGFDYWKILPGQGSYYQPTFINMSGDTIKQPGYATDVVTDEAIRWMNQKRNDKKPFLLYLHHKAPHRNFFPPLKYIRQYSVKTFEEPATLYLDTAGRGTAWHKQTMSILPDMKLCSDLKVDPAYLMDNPLLKPDAGEIAQYNALMQRIPEEERKKIKEIYSLRGKILEEQKPEGKKLLALKYQWYMQDYLACVSSVDENIGRLLLYLDSTGLAKNTVVMFTSDQGFYLGENGWFDKRFMYDVAMRTPLIIRWPQKIKPGAVANQLLQNIDLAPTMLTIAGAKVPEWMQGKSFEPVLRNSKAKQLRSSLYYRYYEYGRDHTVLPHLGVRTNRYKLIYFNTVNEWEFYDLLNDAKEQHNLIGSKKHEALFQNLKKQLIQLRKDYDDTEAAGELN